MTEKSTSTLLIWLPYKGEFPPLQLEGSKDNWQQLKVWQQISNLISWQVEGSNYSSLCSICETTSGVLGLVLGVWEKERLTYWSESSGWPPRCCSTWCMKEKWRELGLFSPSWEILKTSLDEATALKLDPALRLAFFCAGRWLPEVTSNLDSSVFKVKRKKSSSQRS